jgi:hypothetical protein
LMRCYPTCISHGFDNRPCILDMRRDCDEFGIRETPYPPHSDFPIPTKPAEIVRSLHALPNKIQETIEKNQVLLKEIGKVSESGRGTWHHDFQRAPFSRSNF